VKGDASIKAPALQLGDRVRLVSPASTPDRDLTLACAALYESWGLRVEIGDHAFNEYGYLAGTDEARLSDFNEALRDPGVRAIFATRGGRGAYRIADRLDLEAACANPKLVIGFSEITSLHMSLLHSCDLVGLHGPLSSWGEGYIGEGSVRALKNAIFTTCEIAIAVDENEPTSALTTSGTARGRLIGGNLMLMMAVAGWALPSMDGAIVFMEQNDLGLGQIERMLTMLHRGGHLNGVAGFAIGQFTRCEVADAKGWTDVDVLRQFLNQFDVPVLGGLPLGHDRNPLTVPIGAMAVIDTSQRRLISEPAVC
jgi:muramoyltetrapeptide carboxypeptidase